MNHPAAQQGIRTFLNRLWLRARLIGLLLAALLCLRPGLARAHSELVSAEPAPGATVGPSLSEIRLAFNEDLGPASAVAVFTSSFEAVAGIETRTDGPQLIALLSRPLGPGTYTVQWTVASVDAHPASGSYQFAVAEGEPGGLEQIGWWLAGLAAAAAAAAVLIGRRRRAPPSV